MRLFAFYLPQFHEIEENNDWWGKGFTEWTHVSGAKPLFKGHIQPIKPLDNNYYNLLEKETVKWQTELMEKYHVDGMVYYHYYFNGKMLLEKPAENLLNWKDINQPFFFCWANHTWYKAVNGKKKILLEQTYGDKEDWERHFEYLLPFFKDERYEKKDNKPLFMIYNPDFSKKQEMIDYFDRRCKKEGFDGIYIIETFADSTQTKNFKNFHNNICRQTEQLYIREPSFSTCIENRHRKVCLPKRIMLKILRTLSYSGKISWVNKYNGDKLYNIMYKYTPRLKNICHGIFFSWDNTPRHGVRGYIITEPTKETFMKYVKTISNDDYVIINAWNEWAEGMVLEPTEHLKYKYLEWIKEFRENTKNKGDL